MNFRATLYFLVDLSSNILQVPTVRLYILVIDRIAPSEKNSNSSLPVLDRNRDFLVATEKIYLHVALFLLHCPAFRSRYQTFQRNRVLLLWLTHFDPSFQPLSIRIQLQSCCSLVPPLKTIGAEGSQYKNSIILALIGKTLDRLTGSRRVHEARQLRMKMAVVRLSSVSPVNDTV